MKKNSMGGTTNEWEGKNNEYKVTVTTKIIKNLSKAEWITDSFPLNFERKKKHNNWNVKNKV